MLKRNIRKGDTDSIRIWNRKCSQVVSSFFVFFPSSIYPFLFPSHLPHCFNLASSHTHTPCSPLHNLSAHQRIWVMQGAPVNQSGGLLRRRLQTHTKPQTQRHMYTRGHLHWVSDTLWFKTQVEGRSCWGTTNKVCVWEGVRQYKLFLCSTKPNEEQQRSAMSQSMFMHYKRLFDWQQIIVNKCCSAVKIYLDGA